MDKTLRDQLDQIARLDEAAQPDTEAGELAWYDFREALVTWYRSGGGRELAEDGMRYRWLREHIGDFIHSLPWRGTPPTPLIPLQKSLDAAIDAARAKEGKK